MDTKQPDGAAMLDPPGPTKRPAIRQSLLARFWRWLRDGGNQGALTVLLAILVVLAPAGAYVLKTVQLKPSISPLSAESTPTVAPRGVGLSAEQLRTQIAKALANDSAVLALAYLTGSNEPAFIREECDHVFNFSVRRHQLRTARDVANHCWTGERKAQALQEIGLQQLKAR